MLGIFALAALMPAGKLWAGGGNPSIISMSGKNPADGKLVIRISGKFTKEDVNVVPVEGYSITKIDYAQDYITVVLQDHTPAVRGDGNEFETDIMTIIGVDNITGVFVGEGNNSGGAGGYYRFVDAGNVTTDQGDDNNTGSDDNGNLSDSKDPSSGLGSTTSGNSGQVKHDAGFSVYPNPVGEETNVITVGEILGKTIQIIDLGGRVRKTVNIQPLQQFSINLGDLSPGIYLMVMQTEDGRSFVQRITKL